jgi:hypothetical protein
MASGRIIFCTPRRKPKGRLVGRAPLSHWINIKSECQSSVLPDEYQERAAKAYSEGMLWLLDGELRCKCGASVGARKSNMGDFFAPTRHLVYKAPRQPARKRGPRK